MQLLNVMSIILVCTRSWKDASGAEDGYVRLHFFDKSYLDMKDPVPESLQEGEDGFDIVEGTNEEKVEVEE